MIQLLQKVHILCGLIVSLLDLIGHVIGVGCVFLSTMHVYWGE
jgi:hypothetical protein